MSYQNMMISDLMKKFDQGLLILPAIQRGYVWGEQRIYDLFDSLMKGYPIGSFLFWDIDKKEFDQFKFHSFLKNVDTTLTLTDSEEVSEYKNDMIGVLDGQQRLTSLIIGLKGSYTLKVKKQDKVDGKNPEKFLCLNLLSKVSKNSEDRYEFKFLTKQEMALNQSELYEKCYWFCVSELFNMPLNSAKDYCEEHIMNSFEDAKNVAWDAMTTLQQLERVINYDPVILVIWPNKRR